jgi:hypothetical protein
VLAIGVGLFAYKRRGAKKSDGASDSAGQSGKPELAGDQPGDKAPSTVVHAAPKLAGELDGKTAPVSAAAELASVQHQDPPSELSQDYRPFELDGTSSPTARTPAPR